MGAKLKFTIYYKVKATSEVKAKDYYEESQEEAKTKFKAEFPEDSYEIQTII